MPEITCKGCGGQTNTAVCDHRYVDGKPVAKRCYAKWDGTQWVKGCGYNKSHPVWERPLIDKFLAGKGNQREG